MSRSLESGEGSIGSFVADMNLKGKGMRVIIKFKCPREAYLRNLYISSR